MQIYKTLVGGLHNIILPEFIDENRLNRGENVLRKEKTRICEADTAEDTRKIGRDLADLWSPGDLVLFRGELGAGKTTMIRGILEGLGYMGNVRSPTFNLVQTYATQVPVMHADLYRVKSGFGIGLEEYFQSHLCLIEWPERLLGLIEEDDAWKVTIEFAGNGRHIEVVPPFDPS